jgi:hypothetical protein
LRQAQLLNDLIDGERSTVRQETDDLAAARLRDGVESV